MKNIYTIIIYVFGYYFSFGQKPTASFVVSKDTICTHDCVNFTNLSINATNYKWILYGTFIGTDTATNPQEICYDIAGNYSVILIAYNSYGSDTLERMNYISVHPKAGPIYQLYDSLHFINTDSSVISYQWYRNDSIIPGATNKSIVYYPIGTYSIIITDIYGCSDTVVYLPEAVKSYFKDKEISVYPNPVKNQFTVCSAINGHIERIEIFNMLGVKVASPSPQRIEENDMIDISGLLPGMYFLQVIQDDYIGNVKFVKE